jgi:hypothetical protein
MKFIIQLKSLGNYNLSKKKKEIHFEIKMKLKFPNLVSYLKVA